MNADELRHQLDELAGPEPFATPEAREAVRGRVQRTRRRRGAAVATSSVLAAVLIVAIAAAGLRGSDTPVHVRTLSSSTTVPPSPQCRLGVHVTPAQEVPDAVAAWLDGAAAIGHGALWTARRSIAVTPVHEGSIYRLKIGWFARPFGIPEITARRLDGAGRATGDANEAIDQRGRWVVSTIELPSAGCWEITARYGSAVIVFRRLVGNPARPLAIGTIGGKLVEAGGPAPGTARPLPTGSVSIEPEACVEEDSVAPCRDAVSVQVGGSGSFLVDIPVGRYTVTGKSPQYLDGSGGCGGGTVVVTRDHTTHADVVCPVR